MFTGIIEAAGKIESLDQSDEGGKLRVSLAAAPDIAGALKIGDSIAVNGCCLTVVEFDGKTHAADLSGETLRRMSFGEKKTGRRGESGATARCRRAARWTFRARAR